MIMKYNQTGKAFVPETILVVATIFTMSALVGYFEFTFLTGWLNYRIRN